MPAVILVSLFIAAMVLIGIWGMKRTHTLGDFFLGNRNIGPWVSAFAYGTSYFSAVLFIGFAGKLGWVFGLKSLWIGLGNALFGSLLAWLVLGKRTRRMTQNLDVMTMPEFFQERYGAKFMKMITACIIFAFLLPYSASVFKGLGHLFEVNFNLPYDAALLIMIFITGVYLVLGGYFAITLTDFIQGLIMIVGSLAMIAVLAGKAGGLAGSFSAISAKYHQHILPDKEPGNLLLFSLIFMTSFGVWGMPQMVQKFYAVKNEKVINKAAVATTIFALIITFAAYFTGAISHVFYEQAPLVNNVAAFDRLVPDLLKANLSEGLMAVILLLILSASMSTLSSLVLVSASAVAIDLYKGHVNPDVSKERSLAMMRFLSAVFVVISYFIARYEVSIIITLMSLSWGVIAGAFMAPYIYGLYWRRATKISVKVSMFAGIILGIMLFFLLGPENSPLASSIAILVPFIIVPLVSLFTKPPSGEIIQRAFKNI